MSTKIEWDSEGPGEEVTKVPEFNFGRAHLYQSDCIAWLKNRSEKSIQAVVTDANGNTITDGTSADLRAAKRDVKKVLEQKGLI